MLLRTTVENLLLHVLRVFCASHFIACGTVAQRSNEQGVYLESHAGLFKSKGGNVAPSYSLCPPSMPLLFPVVSGIIDGDSVETVRTPW